MDVTEASQVQYSKDTATFKLHGIGNTMLHNLNLMRNDGLFCDISLKNKTDPQSENFSSYQAHACVLAANSQLFYDILTPDANIKEIHLELFSDTVLELCINLVYGELVDVPLDIIDDLKSVAENLGINSLIKICDEISQQIEERQISAHIKEEKLQDSHQKDNESDAWASKLASESMLVSIIDDILLIENQSSLSNKSLNVTTDSHNDSPKKKLKVSFDEVHEIGHDLMEHDLNTKEKDPSKAKIHGNSQTKSVSMSKYAKDLYCDQSTTGPNPLKSDGKLTSENDLHCSHCDRYFANFRVLKEHKLRLTGKSKLLSVTNLRCDLCNREFMYRGSLRRHKAVCGNNGNTSNIAASEENIKPENGEHKKKGRECRSDDSPKAGGLGKSESDPNYTYSATETPLASDSVKHSSKPKGNNEENDSNDQTHNDVMHDAQQLSEETTKGNSTVDKKYENLYCDHCERFFANKYSFRKHLKRVREADDPNRNSLTKTSSKIIPYRKEQVYCNHCDSYFANPSSLHRHKTKVALSKDPYNYRLMLNCSRPESKIHVNQGFPKKDVYCDHCDGVFRNPMNLRLHKRRVQMAADPFNYRLLSKKPKSQTGENETKPAHEEIYCDHCDRTFCNPTSLKAHKKRIELSSNPYEHRLTGKKMTRAERLAGNKKRYREPSQCELCGEIFSTRFKRESHMNTVHEKKYYCKLCDKYWASQQALDEHLRRHTGEKSYLCSKCDFRAVTNYEIKIHEDLHHSEEMFLCKECGKYSKSLRALRTHQRQAHGRKRVKLNNEPCPICKRVFARREHFRRHMLHVHNIDVPKKNLVMLRNSSDATREEKEFAQKDDFFQEEVSLDVDAQESALNTSEADNVLESGTNEFDASGMVLTSENESIAQNFEVHEVVADQEYVLYVSEEQFQSLVMSQQK